MTPLHLSTQNGSIETSALLLLKGANPNTHVEGYTATALHLAVHGGHTKTVKLLFEFGAEYRDDILPIAVLQGYPKLVEFLLENHPDSNGVSYLLRKTLRYLEKGFPKYAKILTYIAAKFPQESEKEFAQKTALDLSGCRISFVELEKTLPLFKSLETLKIQNLGLSNLPSSLLSLRATLKNIDFSGNPLDMVPEAVRKKTELKDVWAYLEVRALAL
jgi:ankyrin repeat protein